MGKGVVVVIKSRLDSTASASCDADDAEWRAERPAHRARAQTAVVRLDRSCSFIFLLLLLLLLAHLIVLHLIATHSSSSSVHSLSTASSRTTTTTRFPEFIFVLFETSLGWFRMKITENY